jgi:hypothetical protein
VSKAYCNISDIYISSWHVEEHGLYRPFVVVYFNCKYNGISEVYRAKADYYFNCPNTAQSFAYVFSKFLIREEVHLEGNVWWLLDRDIVREKLNMFIEQKLKNSEAQ